MKRLFLVLCVLIFMFGMTVTPAIAEDVELAWDANTEPDLWGYRLYRDLTSGGHERGPASPHLVDFIECGPNDASCAGYWELLLPNSTTFYWVVTAVDNAGNESGKSNEVEHTTSAVVDDPPNNPTGCWIKTVVP
jgi:hypothetical protein